MSSSDGPGESSRVAPAKVLVPIIDERFVRRRRVEAAFHNSARVVLVVAPAGFGKTTVAAQWIRQLSQPTAWYTVDVHDGSPERFWRYLAAAIRRAVPDVGAETLGAIDDWAIDGIDMASVLLAELGDERPPMTMVIDDLHLVSSAEIIEQLAFFLDRSPAWLRVVLVSRSVPRLPIARWRAQGVVSELRQGDLALSDGEALQAIARMPFLELSPAGQRHLIGLADGWPVALQLAALALGGREDSEQVVKENLHGNRLLFDYVVGEVLDRLPALQRDAVMELSMLDDIDPRRCEALTGVEDGEGLLLELVRLGLPLVALEPGEHTYRFHRVFRELVHLELQLRKPSSIRAIHRRAAAAELRAGDHPAAVRHLLAAGEQQQAFELVFGPVWDLYRAGATRELSMWLDQFPPEFVGDDPIKIVQFATTLSLVGRPDDAALWNERASATVADSDPLAPALALSRMLVLLARGDTAAVWSEMERLDAAAGHPAVSADPERRFTSVMAITALIDESIGEAAGWVGALGSTGFGDEHFRAVGQPARRAWLAYEQGALDQADWLAGIADEGGRGAAHARVEALVVRAKVAAERLAAQEAAGWAERANELAAAVESPQRVMLHHELAHEALLASIELRDGVEAAVEACSAMASPAVPEPLMGRYRLMTAELLARSQRWDHCERILEQLPPTPRRLLVEARLAIGRNMLPAARRLLEEADTMSWPLRRQVEAALLLHCTAPDDRTHVIRAVALGAPCGFVWTFVREGDALGEVLRSVVDADSQWRSTRLAAALHASVATSSPGPHQLAEQLSAREQEVLVLLPTHLSTVELARRLYVSTNTIRTHVKAIYRKLGVNSRSEAVVVAAKIGLVSPAAPVG